MVLVHQCIYFGWGHQSKELTAAFGSVGTHKFLKYVSHRRQSLHANKFSPYQFHACAWEQLLDPCRLNATLAFIVPYPILLVNNALNATLMKLGPCLEYTH